MSYPILLSNLAPEDVEAVDAELKRAEVHEKHFSSLHEAYAVILEEVDEIWDEVRKKKRDRKVEDLRKEFVQLAAMAFKGLQSLNNFVGGTV